MINLGESLALWIERKLPRPQLRLGATGRPRRPVKRIIVFGRMPNPTFDYYFAARLKAPGMPPWQAVDIRHGNLADLDSEGAFIIVCRYTSAKVLTWLEYNADRLSGAGLFVDDDIPAVVTGRDASLRYRLILCFRALWPLRRLSRHLDIVWASTPHLASTLQLEDVQVLPPAPPETLWKPRRDESDVVANAVSDQVLIAYHATGVHLEEHHFLRPIIEDVLAQRPQVRFEVFADGRSKLVWRDLKRVTIRRPLPWKDYLNDADRRRIDIMLVPLAPSRVNDSRAPTKRIDVTRYGAAGLFSEGFAFGQDDQSAEMRLPYEQTTWQTSILTLVDDRTARTAAASATLGLVVRAGSESGMGLSTLSANCATGLEV
ncbi:hypothetical protein [Ensifer sp. Root127]|uniref:hypothetical protein n=1 Tax=Ensifer sp. Root127 TaxID=1736440 RepID=UPI00070AD737|nr:hypothetical protein [Ensifer sp. Root127]KQW54778.1 hypothetical protein ASD03_19610 [Ensifer sp. Root127]